MYEKKIIFTTNYNHTSHFISQYQTKARLAKRLVVAQEKRRVFKWLLATLETDHQHGFENQRRKKK